MHRRAYYRHSGRHSARSAARPTIVALTLAALLLCPPPLQAGRLPGEAVNEFHTGYPTPHIPWAKPYAPGRIKAFFIAPFTAAREVTELAQRLDLEVRGETTFTAVILGATDMYSAQVAGTSPAEKRDAMVRKLAQRHDVIVLANFPFDKLPVQVQYLIARQVVAGAGLVLVYPRGVRRELYRHPLAEAARGIDQAVPLAGLDFYRHTLGPKLKLAAKAIGPKVVTTYRAGKGRVVRLDFGEESDAKFGGFCLTPRERFTFRSPAQYEYHQMLVINAVVWAAGREPPVRVVPPGWCAKPLDQSALPRPVRMILDNRGERLAARVDVALRNPWGQVEWKTDRQVQLNKGANPISLNLPHLGGGGHYLDVRIRGANGAVGWGAFWVEVRPSVGIASLAMDRLSFERHETASGVVCLKSKCPGSGFAVRIELRDNYDRLYAKTQVPLAKGADQARFAVPLTGAVSLAGRCRAKLVRARRLVDQTETDFFVPKRQLDVFPTFLWGTFPGMVGHFFNNKLRSVGFNAILLSHFRPDNDERGGQNRISAVARDDMLAVVYITHISFWGRVYGHDRAYAQARPKMTRAAEWVKPYGPLIYSLGDENSMRRMRFKGFVGEEQPGWIRYLKGRYGSLAALNKAWGTTLKHWTEATSIDANEARPLKRYVQYHDTQTYREDLYARWHHWHHDLFKRIDPYAKVGSEGSAPGDLEKTVAGLEFWGPYRRRWYNALLRSLAPRPLLRGNWFGGYVARRRDLPGLKRFVWDTLLDGSNLFEIYCCATVENLTKTDLTMGDWAKAFLPDLKEVVDGIGQLAAASQHDTDAVAVHHSQPNVHASDVHTPFGDSRRRLETHDSVLALLAGAGFQVRYVTDRQIRRGVLRKASGAKVLVLPYAQAMSDKEAVILKRFVEAGGVVIADVCPGILDGRCSRRSVGVLDELFGVRRDQGLTKAARARMTVPATRIQARGTSVQVPSVIIDNLDVDQAVRLAGGQALGRAAKVPAVVVRRHGKGLAVLLNFSLADCRSLKPEVRGAVRDLMGGFVSLAGVKPFCRAFGPDGQALPGCRLPRFRRGAVTTLMVLRSREGGDKPSPAVLRLAAPVHVYDQRTAKYYGRTNELQLQLDPTSATVLSLLPYAVTGLRVTGPRQVDAGRAARMNISLVTAGHAKPSGHVFRVKLYGPDGHERWHCARTLRPDPNAPANAVVDIPFAYNDPPGRWTVRVRDVATRKESRVALVVK